jgi:hypothetical protein
MARSCFGRALQLEFDGVLVDVCLREIYAMSNEADHLGRSAKGEDVDLLYLLKLVDSVFNHGTFDQPHSVLQ